MIEHIANAKAETGVSPTSVNRMLEIIRAILRRAKDEWEWLDNTPSIRMRSIDNKRVRWITPEEIFALLNELPEHLRDMAEFTLATGLRESNVTGLQWSAVDLEQRHALVHPDQSKTNKAIPVPLNQTAIRIIRWVAGQLMRWCYGM